MSEGNAYVRDEGVQRTAVYNMTKVVDISTEVGQAKHRVLATLHVSMPHEAGERGECFVDERRVVLFSRLRGKFARIERQ